MSVRALLIGVSIAALGSVAAQAADLIIPTTPEPIYEAAGFDWEGLYVGARAGGQFTGSDASTYAGYPISSTSGVLGVAAGVNFLPMDPLLVGVEVTGDYIWNNAFSTGEFFANLRAGAVVTDSVLVYAIGGVGTNNRTGFNQGVYQLGGGVELAVTDSISVRGELVGQGDFDGAADPFFETAKATVGVYYHF
ncbi:outer membrane protein [Devosia sp. XGJD_8]|jgi:outer membrane immunogenic protein|uniref:outer membrane protein n=1 Tax=Devosia sp. XGJD_8 TaxID=3391187 RepID=UPI0039849229